MNPSIPLSRPSISEREVERVMAVLQSGRLATGPATDEFEAALRRFCGVDHAVAVSSGTAALHLIVRGLGLGEGDEVITTPYSFVASSNVLLFENIRPVFVDVDPVTYCIDVQAIEAAVTARTRAILAVDVFGVPADWRRLTTLAAELDLLLIDDACEALGAATGGAPTGSWGAAAAFGFYPNKQITTGEGGCITTGSETLAAYCRSARNQGRSDEHTMNHVRLGYNYRMTEVSAALGCAQLERFGELTARRETVAREYSSRLASVRGIRLPTTPDNAERSWFVYVVELEDPLGRADRDELVERLAADGIESAPYFPSIHLQPLYRQRFGYAPGTFPVSEGVSNRTLALPFYPDLTPDQIDRVADRLGAALGSIRERRPAGAPRST